MRRLLQAGLTLLLVATIAAGADTMPFVVGSESDRQIATRLGVVGCPVESIRAVPDGARVLVLGGVAQAGGVDELDYLDLVSRACAVIRLGGAPGVRLESAVRRHLAILAAGRDPFADIARTMGETSSPGLRLHLQRRRPTGKPQDALDPAFRARLLYGVAVPEPALDTLSTTAAVSTAAGRRLDAAGRLVLGVRFVEGSAALATRSLPLLRQVQALLKSRPGLKVTIAAHLDAASDANDPQDLAQARADAVKQWLVARGIEPGRLRTIGRGVARVRSESGSSATTDPPECIEIVRD